MKSGTLAEIAAGILEITKLLIQHQERIEDLQTAVTEVYARLDLMDEPVLWVCYNSQCGAPNTLPAILWTTGVLADLRCSECGGVAPIDHYKQFAPEGTL